MTEERIFFIRQIIFRFWQRLVLRNKASKNLLEKEGFSIPPILDLRKRVKPVNLDGGIFMDYTPQDNLKNFE